MTQNNGKDLNERRIRRLDAQDIFINHIHANKIMEHLEYHVNLGRTNGCRGMFITGHSGAGKTTLCKRISKKYHRVSNPDREIFKVLYINCPSKPTMKSIMFKILEAYQAPGSDRGTAEQLESRIKHYARECGTRLLIIDEIQHLISLRDARTLTAEGGYTLNLIKNISNETETNIALVGTPITAHLLTSDAQIGRRLGKRFNLPLLKPDQNLSSILRTIEGHLKLNKESFLYKEPLCNEIWDLTSGMISEIMPLLRESAKKAIETGTEMITSEILNSCKHLVIRLTTQEVDKFAKEGGYDFFEN